MTVKELEEILMDMPEDAEIVLDLGSVNVIDISGVEFDKYQYAVYIY